MRESNDNDKEDTREREGADTPAENARGGPLRRRLSPDPKLVAIGKRIRNYRLKRGISQEALAHQALIVRSIYGSIERGEINFGVLRLLEIAQGLQLDPSALLPSLEELDSLELADTAGDQSAKRMRPGPKPGTSRGKRYSTKHHVEPGAEEGGAREAGEAGETASVQTEIETTSDSVSGAAEQNAAPALVSAGAAARILGVNRRTVVRWVRQGLVQAQWMEDSPGKRVLVFDRSDILRLDKQRHRKTE
ncbi:MAG TPA: XRE family transcriptional regulator [Chloroflexia bacterium]|jgi:transcriptional regulator with XRE-family HTH domain